MLVSYFKTDDVSKPHFFLKIVGSLFDPRPAHGTLLLSAAKALGVQRFGPPSSASPAPGSTAVPRAAHPAAGPTEPLEQTPSPGVGCGGGEGREQERTGRFQPPNHQCTAGWRGIPIP